MKKVFLKLLQNAQENNCARDPFNKGAGLRPATLLKTRIWSGISCESREIFKNTFFLRKPLVAASVSKKSDH